VDDASPGVVDLYAKPLLFGVDLGGKDLSVLSDLSHADGNVLIGNEVSPGGRGDQTQYNDQKQADYFPRIQHFLSLQAGNLPSFISKGNGPETAAFEEVI
jgi:hypothetical protein